MVTKAINIPWMPNCFIVAGVKMPSLGLRGFSFKISLVECSMPMAMAGKESVTRLMNNRCTGKKGSGNANKEAASTQMMPDKFPLNK